MNYIQAIKKLVIKLNLVIIKNETSTIYKFGRDKVIIDNIWSDFGFINKCMERSINARL